MKKILSLTEAANSGLFNRVELEIHGYRKSGNGIPLPGLAGVELIIEQQEAFKKNRNPLMIANLTIEAAMELQRQLGMLLADSCGIQE